MSMVVPTAEEYLWSMTSLLAKGVSKKVKNISTNILIVGGAYAGLSALVALKNHLRSRNNTLKVDVTLVEPKAGLLNVIGIPRAIVDLEFAKTQYVPFEDLEGLRFHKLISDDGLVCDTLGSHLEDTSLQLNFNFTFIQGTVEDLTSTNAVYSLNNTEGKANISFDYAVISTGRNRQWPTSPLAHNFESYIDEMIEFNKNVSNCKLVGIIGAGAVGIEIAGDIKNRFKDKKVYLIHPHEKFPPEPLPEEFKDACRKSLEESGVHILNNRRVKHESDSKMLTFTNGEKLQTDFNYWCNSFKNNTEFLGADLKKYVTEHNNIHVNEYLQLKLPHEEAMTNLFAIGDLVEFPIIKSAGWALYMGRQVANNLVSLIFDGVLVESMPDLTQIPKGMVLIAGDEELVSLLDGIVEINNESYVEEYKDYCLGKIRATLGA